MAEAWGVKGHTEQTPSEVPAVSPTTRWHEESNGMMRTPIPEIL